MLEESGVLTVRGERGYSGGNTTKALGDRKYLRKTRKNRAIAAKTAIALHAARVGYFSFNRTYAKYPNCFVGAIPRAIAPSYSSANYPDSG
ncbi:MAG: hypothetical protein F6J93_18205 [Oscillatoria sp. SIO1A7]|nr:hypothetical protein [Oscillatoria sp. SIO1A7]